MADPLEMEPPVNVLGEKLEPCSTAPMTGFFRNGAAMRARPTAAPIPSAS